MTVRGATTQPSGWYNWAEAVAYPFHEQQAAGQVPSDIVADLQISGPSDKLLEAFLTGLSCDEQQLSIVLEVLGAGGVYRQLQGSLTPAEPYSPVLLTSTDDDLRGVVVFGAAAGRRRFLQSWDTDIISVLPRCLSIYPPRSATDIRLYGSNRPLTSLGLRGFGDLTATRRTVQLEVPTEVTVLRLPLEAESGTRQLEYLGNCGRRAESADCVGNQPIERVSGVTADCDHTLTLKFEGDGLRILPLLNACGIAVKHDLTVEEACYRPQPPDEDDTGDNCVAEAVPEI